MIVLDCSVAVTCALSCPQIDTLDPLILEAEEVVAPTLLYEEVAHALAKYQRAGELTRLQAHTVGMYALALVDRFIDPLDYWEEACHESVRLGHSSYDLFYFLIARRMGATLVTLDRNLQALCRKQDINCTEIVSLQAMDIPRMRCAYSRKLELENGKTNSSVCMLQGLLPCIGALVRIGAGMTLNVEFVPNKAAINA